MKTYFSLFISLISAIAFAQNTNPNFDANLAKKHGADEYGMKKYIFIVLKTGTNTSKDAAFTKKCFSGHMDNINKMVNDKKLIVAGPMGKNENALRGIFILDVSTIEDAKVLLQADPAIKENLLEAEYYEWYGSAALAEYLSASDKIWQKSP
jgi:uncharacterized protein YciI